MRKVLGKDGLVSHLEMTKADWKRKHRDFKKGRLGTKRCMAMCLDTDGGTVLVTVVKVEED